MTSTSGLRTICRLAIPLVLGSWLASACGGEKQVDYVEDKQNPAKVDPGAGRRSFQYEGKLTNNVTGFRLADATAFTMSLSGCASSHTATVTETSTYLEVYEFDRNCVVKLDQFTLNTKVYTPKSGAGFSTWAVGDKATFEAGAGDELTLEVITTVDSPVTTGGTVKYQFSTIEAGSDVTIGEAIVRESKTLEVSGQDAPNFTISQSQLVGITTDGNGEFRFQLQCGEAVTGSAATSKCYDVLLSDIKMVLTEDTYSGTLTVSQADAIFTSNSGGVAIESGNYLAAGAGTPAVANGGFITSNTGHADVLKMSGAKPIHSHPNMLLLLKAGPSYLYINVDVEIISQSGDGP